MSKYAGYAQPLRLRKVGTAIVNHLLSADGDQTFRGIPCGPPSARCTLMPPSGRCTLMPPSERCTDRSGLDCRGIPMSKKIEKTLTSLLFALVTSGGSSKMH